MANGKTRGGLLLALGSARGSSGGDLGTVLRSDDDRSKRGSLHPDGGRLTRRQRLTLMPWPCGDMGKSRRAHVVASQYRGVIYKAIKIKS